MLQSRTSFWQKLLRATLKTLCCLALTMGFSRPVHSWCNGNQCMEPGTCCGSNGCVPCCVPSPDNTKCDDGEECSTNDRCENGVCVSEKYTGGTCDDGNVCTAKDFCYGGYCLGGEWAIGSCDDGNACTQNDQCVRGECTGTQVSCDDGNICTSDTCDPATAECTSVPISCDDFSACTADSCDPILGCVHIGLPKEAGPLAFLDQVTLEWGPALGSWIYNTYRGTIPARGLGSRSQAYDHVCFVMVYAQPDAPQPAVDTEAPPVGTGFYYLVDGEVLSCGEGPLGTATDGTPETPVAFCPTPP